VEEFKQMHLEEMKKIRNEFIETLKMMELKMSGMVNKYQELREKFDTRPSREDDMTFINQLQEEIINKERQLKEAEENMEKFRNMLINNEENYNKYFGANHKIGYINPLKGKEMIVNGNTDKKDNYNPAGSSSFKVTFLYIYLSIFKYF
jgi:hypothetical protein